MRDVVLFVFAGRRENMKLQLPLVQRVLRDNPNVSYHIWNLARDGSDYRYIQQQIPRDDRIIVFDQFYGANPWKRFNDVYQYYSHSHYADHLFVKIDDDVVFFQAKRFDEFVKAIEAHRDSVISAKVINNGACTPTEPGLWEQYEKLGIPLLDVHLYDSYADVCHDYVDTHFDSLEAQPIRVIPTADWLSINMIGYDWMMGHRIADTVGSHSPETIAGRHFHGGKVGDEGAVNMFPRKILQGFLACHLGFSPQVTDDEQVDGWRAMYDELGQKYLAD